MCGRISLFLLFFNLLSLPLRGARNPYDPTSDLLNSFGPGCASLGRSTQKAIGQANSLRKIILSMEEDSKCENIVNALNQVDITNSQLEALYMTRNRSLYEDQRDSQIKDLLVASEAETDTTVKSSLVSQMATLRTEQLMSQNTADAEREALKFQGTKNLITYSENLFAALRSNPDCLQKRPGLALQLGAQVLALSSNWANTSQSPFIYAGGALADQFFSLISSKKYSNWVKQSDNAKMGVALNCAMESLSRTYCEARDSTMLVESFVKSRQTNVGAEDNWEGFYLLQRDSRKYLSWIRKVVTGSLASSPSGIIEKVRGYELETALKASEDLIHATYNSYVEKLSQPGVDENSVLRRFINEIVSAMNTSVYSSITNGSGFTPPFYYVFSEDPNCGPRWYLYTGEVSGGSNDTGGCKNQEISAMDPPPLSVIKERYDQKIREAQVAVSLEVSLVRETDPGFILALSEDGGASVMTALQFLQATNTYLINLRASYGAKVPMHTNSLLDDTILRVEKSLEIMSGLPAKMALMYEGDELPDNRDFFETISQVQEWLAPKQNSFLLTKRLRQFINWEISQKLKEGRLSESDQVKIALAIVLDEKISALLDFGLVELDSLVMDARNAREISRKNLSLLWDVFSETLLGRFAELADAPEGDWDSAHNLDQLCIQILSVPKKNGVLKARHKVKKDTVGATKFEAHRYSYSSTVGEICSGRVLKSIFNVESLNLDFNTYVQSKNYSKKACAFYDWKRKARIFSYK